MPSAFLPPIVNAIICMWRGNFDTATWFVAVKMSFPFDTTSVHAWYMQLILVMFLSIQYIVTVTSIFTYLTCCCLYIDAIRNCFKSMFNGMDAKITFYQTIEKTKKTDEDFREMIIFTLKVTE